MPPTAVAQIGVPLVMTQNTIYGLPTKRTLGFAATTTANLQVNMTNTGGTWVTISPASEGKFETAAPFIRTTDAAGTTILLKTI